MDQWKELRERFSKLTDEELLKIVTVEAADYRKEAVDIAKSELRSRGVPLERPTIEDPVDDDNPASLDPRGQSCVVCGGQMRQGTLVAEKELTIVFSDNREERFVRVSVCSRCGQLSMLADLETDVQGS